MTSKRKLQAAFDFNEMRLTSLIFKEWRAVNDRESRQKFKKDLEAIKHHRRYCLLNFRAAGRKGEWELDPRVRWVVEFLSWGIKISLSISIK